MLTPSYVIQEKCFKFKYIFEKCGGLLINSSLFKKELIPHGKMTSFFLSLYTKTHLWACTRLEMRGGLACTRNGPKTQFQYKSMDFALPTCEYHGKNNWFYSKLFLFIFLYENLCFWLLKIQTVSSTANLGIQFLIAILAFLLLFLVFFSCVFSPKLVENQIWLLPVFK